MKRVLEIIRTVIVWIVVAAAVAMMIFTIVSVNTFDRNDRDLFGFKAFIVLSDSMSATDFDAGDLVLVKEVDPSTLKEGDIISYISQNSHNYGETVTHKIRTRVTLSDGEPGFITYGTTTDTNDEAIVTYPYIVGQYKFTLPKVGTFFQFLKTTPGYICCILIPFVLLILNQGINCVKIFRMYKAEQMAEIEEEKARIEEERQQSAEMMKELLALKAQLAGQGAAPTDAPPTESPAAEVPAASDSLPLEGKGNQVVVDEVEKDAAPTEAPAPVEVPEAPAPEAPAAADSLPLEGKGDHKVVDEVEKGPAPAVEAPAAEQMSAEAVAEMMKELAALKAQLAAQDTAPAETPSETTTV